MCTPIICAISLAHPHSALPNGSSIESAVLPQLTFVTNGQTDGQADRQNEHGYQQAASGCLYLYQRNATIVSYHCCGFVGQLIVRQNANPPQIELKKVLE